LLPLYSPHTRMSMILLKMRNGELERVPKTSEMELPEKAYRARISLASPLPRFTAGTKETLYFKTKNLGEASWPSRVRCDGRFQVNIGNRWLDANGRTVVNDLDSRNVLPDDLRPGEETEIALTVTAPVTSGDYVLEIDMVHEGVTWFHERGSETLRIRVRVEL